MVGYGHIFARFLEIVTIVILYTLMAIGHRIVQGGPKHFKPVIITGALIQVLDKLVYLAPNHLPDELTTIRAFQSAIFWSTTGLRQK